MTMTLEQLCIEAITLPNESKAILADRLIESIGNNIDFQITRSHLEEVKNRRDEIRSGIISPIPGEDALARVRAIVGK